MMPPDDETLGLRIQLDAARAELTRAQKCSERLAQLYAARSQCSAAILRCHSEAELFPLICRAAVEYGGLSMAWIGMVKQATRRVEPVASFGDEQQYLRDIQISVDVASPTAHGPTGLAIRTNQPVWCADFHADPRTIPWRERASRAGWASSASLPLRRDGIAIGALNLYAKTTDGFDQGTRSLVEELATDLSMTLDAFVRDAEHQRIERENRALTEQNHKLKKSESLSRMAGAIAHHFNNQFHALMLNLEVAMDGLPHTSEQFEALTDAWQAAHNAADVSSQMLAYLGHVHSKRELLDLSECCKATISALRPRTPRDVLTEAHLPTPGPTIRGNATDLHRVLANLLRNAQEAMGTIRQAIRVSVKTVAVEEISSVNRAPVDWHAREPRYACLEVADAGSGIAADALESLFDPFFSTKFTGRGLGLPVALGIVRAHDGVFTVETAPGQGSVFRAYFPLAHGALAPRPNAEQAISQPAARGTVLLVDDEPGVRRALARTLEREAFTVLQADDGDAALALVRQRGDEVDCVLCDVSMPAMNGWQVLTALHALAPGLPVILASGYSEAQVLEGEHAEQPAAFLGKPYDTELLLQTLRHVLSSHPMQGSD